MVTKLIGIDTSSLLRSGPPQNALIRHAQTSDLILQHSDLLELTIANCESARFTPTRHAVP
jgi:hypothetical protein